MFTGLITDLGRVRRIDSEAGGVRLVIETAYDLAAVEIGASIACSGACLTVVEKGADSFAADVSAETLACTTIGGWKAGDRVNLEQSLRLGDALGGHLVSGHVDAVTTVLERRPDGDSQRFSFLIPPGCERLVAAKGSVCLDGVSLTVNEVEADRFGINVIPHTAERTTFGALGPGDRVNLEVDLIARYVARLMPRN
ncbi:MAG: riboflavin synthase [Alphaproteobacteria bacterium]|nr:riboflavin synthase [Alphaproteobacteria bacterium]